MKNLFLTLSLLSGVVVAGDIKEIVHAMVHIENVRNQHPFLRTNDVNDATYKVGLNYSMILPEPVRPLFKEARKNYPRCFSLEKTRRLAGDTKDTPLLKMKPADLEFYQNSCPENFWQNLSDDVFWPEAVGQNETQKSQAGAEASEDAGESAE